MVGNDLTLKTQKLRTWTLTSFLCFWHIFFYSSPFFSLFSSTWLMWSLLIYSGFKLTIIIVCIHQVITSQQYRGTLSNAELGTVTGRSMMATTKLSTNTHCKTVLCSSVAKHRLINSCCIHSTLPKPLWTMGKYSAVFSRKDEGKNLKATNPAHISMTNAAANNSKGCSETDRREKSCNPLTGRYCINVHSSYMR